MPKADKTIDEAKAYAETLTDHGDAKLFMELFNEGKFDIIRGHFPDFYETKGGK